VAKRAGVKVEVFSLGIGHFFCSWSWKGTIYALSWLPLGGYVRMAGQQDLVPPPDHDPKPWEYGAKKPIVRMAIIAAGVTMNFIGGWLCYSASFMVGRDVEVARVGELAEANQFHQRALAAGLREGDRIVSVNGDPVYSRTDLEMRVARLSPGSEVKLSVKAAGQGPDVRRAVTLEALPADVRGLSTIRDYLGNTRGRMARRAGFAAEPRLIIVADRRQLAEYPSWEKLFAPADRFEEVNGCPCTSEEEFHQVLEASQGRTLEVGVVGEDGRPRRVELPLSRRFLVGIEFSRAERGLKVVNVMPGMPAARAGIGPGDRILFGEEAREVSNEELVILIQQSHGQEVKLTVEHLDGRREVKRLIPRPTGWFPDPGGTGTVHGPYGDSLLVTSVQEDSQAARKDLRAGDAIIKIGLESTDPARPVRLSWARGGVVRGPHRMRTYPDGPEIEWWLPHHVERLQLGPLVALGAGWSGTVETVKGTTVLLRKMISGRTSAKGVMGPVGIVGVAYESAREGLGKMLWLLGLIGVSLAFFNLLPIPVLDGGHLAFLAYEMLVRRPPSARAVEIAQYVGLMIILSLFVFVFWNDLHRIFAG
jgi:regulator of sigma E protease